MPNFHRFYLPNSIIFITNVTRERKPIFADMQNLEIYRETMRLLKEHHAFQMLAYVILPDHFHWLLQMKDQSGDFSKIMHSFKRGFTMNYRRRNDLQQPVSLWQSRFWDHVIRDETDLQKHFDYIHWNPVKHGYVKDACEWSNSSYGYWFEKAYYGKQWGMDEPSSITGMDFE